MRIGKLLSDRGFFPHKQLASTYDSKAPLDGQNNQSDGQYHLRDGQGHQVPDEGLGEDGGEATQMQDPCCYLDNP
jgi:hypothetical protein